MKTVSAIILLLTVGVSTAVADLVNGSFNEPIVQQSSWTAGTDATGVWYGPGYVTGGGYASLADAQTGNRTKDMNDARRGLFQAIELTEAYEKEDLELLGKLHADVCMGCGVCSYVCPAKRLLSPGTTLARQFYLKGVKK